MHLKTLLIVGLTAFSAISAEPLQSPKHAEFSRSWGKPMRLSKTVVQVRPEAQVILLQATTVDLTRLDMGLRIEMVNLNPTGLVLSTNDVGQVITNAYGDVYSQSIAYAVQAHTGTNGLPETVVYDGTNYMVGTNHFDAPIIVTDWSTGSLTATNSTPYKIGFFSSQAAQISWNSLLGRNYQVEYSTNLASWTNLTQLVLAGTGARIQTLDDGTKPVRFYRVRSWTQ